MYEFNMQEFYYIGTGIIALLALAIFIAGVIIAHMPVTRPRQPAYSMVRKHPRRNRFKQ